MYRVPTGPLAEEIDLELRHGNPAKIVNKHPWIALEDKLWQNVPTSVWTSNPEDATFFVVPHAYLLHQCVQNTELKKNYIRRGIARWFEYLYYAQPFFNRSAGRDHLTIWHYENGPLCDCNFRAGMVNETLAFDMLLTFIKVGHYGHRDRAMFGWREGIDIAVPQYGAADAVKLGPPPTWSEVVSSPRFSFGFSGSFWGQRVTCPAIQKGAPAGSLAAEHSCECSPKIRTWLKGYLEKHCDAGSAKSGNSSLGSTATAKPTFRCEGRAGKMGTFFFALCPAAWACWSSRMYHAIDRLVIPVIMANGAIQPFEAILDWRTFSVRLDTDRLIAGNTSQMDWLHREARVVVARCQRCPTCTACTRLPLVQRVRKLAEVRNWMAFNESTPYSVGGLLILELHCRQWHREHAASEKDGICLHYMSDQQLQEKRSEWHTSAIDK